MKKYFVLALFLLVLDQLSKWFFQERTIDLGVISLHLVTNTGALFGMFQGWNLLFIFLSLAVLVLVWFLLREEVLVRDLFIVGILGNVIDRIFLGYVRDFIDVGFWPVFNVADASITIGVFLLLLSLVREYVSKKNIRKPYK